MNDEVKITDSFKEDDDRDEALARMLTHFETLRAIVNE